MDLKDKLLFNSYTDPIPPLRFDIQRIPVNQNGNSFIYFFDQLGYATPNFALPVNAEPILSLIDGSRSVEDIIKFSSDEVTKEQILGYARFLDENTLLHSEYFESQAELIESEYESASSHNSNVSDTSYVSDSDTLNDFLESSFKSYESSETVSSAKALYAPHIDLRVGMEAYVQAFSSIRNLTPKRVFILATSHYSGLYGDLYSNKPFILSKKDFDLPNGLIKTNSSAISLIKEQTQHDEIFGTSFSDRAHRIEHSIDIHLSLLNHIWKHDFEIIPVIVGSFDELLYSEAGFLAHQIEAFTYLLNQQFSNDTFFLISGDLSHFGKKFGDADPAQVMFDEIEEFDTGFLKAAANNNPKAVIQYMKSNFDAYRICGFPPLYTFLRAFPEAKGRVLNRELYNEKNTESAVSYGSILFE